MSDDTTDGTDFITALDAAGEESLDDLAHYRPNRHAPPTCGFQRAFGIEDAKPEPIVPRTYPEDGCPRACTACHTPFKFGEIIHPDLDGTRCIPCFKVHRRNFGRGLAAAFRSLATPANDEERAAQDRAVQRTIDYTVAVYRAADIGRAAVAAFGVPSPFQLRRAAQMLREIPAEIEANMPHYAQGGKAKLFVIKGGKGRAK